MADRVGQQLGNYQLVRLIGRGGFADVYLGEHIYLHTKAAIKVLQTRLEGADLQGFLNEARTIAGLTHPRIIRVLDFGVQEDTPFLVMDYAPHGTLRQRHPRGTLLPLELVVIYVRQIAEALQYAHEKKLIHRDVKPENMLLGSNNEILLSDFGIALVSQTSRYQGTYDVVGTAAYMAPEQLQGKPRPASDQYALGVVVYEWLSGDAPFHGTFTEVASQHLFVTPPPLRQKLSNIPPDVERIMQVALAKDPQQRFASVQAFATALEQASQEALPTVRTPVSPQQSSFVIPPQASLDERYEPTVAATPPGPAVQPTIIPTPMPNSQVQLPKQTGISRRTVLLGSAGLLGLAVGGTLATLALTGRLQASQAPAGSTATPISTHVPTANPTSAPVSTSTPAPTSPPSPAPTNPSPAGTTFYTYRGHSDEVFGISWTRDGSRIATGSADKTVQLWRAPDGQTLNTFQDANQVYTVAWSPDGTSIAYGGADSKVNVQDATSGNIISTYSGHSAAVHYAAWSPDGTRIASASFDTTVQVWDASTGNNIVTYHDSAGAAVRTVAWSPSGQLIASAGDGGTVQVWSTANANFINALTGHSGHIEDVEWSPNALYIASAGQDNTARIWNANTGSSTYTYTGHSNVVWSVAWSPDSRRIASASSDHTAKVWQAT